MYEIVGKHNTAKVFAKTLEETAVSQIINLCNQEFMKNDNIAIMPDAHAGAGCTIGTTISLKSKKVVPNLVGYDIGCSVSCVHLDVDNDYFSREKLKELDNIIYDKIPSGFSVRSKVHKNALSFEKTLRQLICLEDIEEQDGKYDRIMKSIGTLGGGNHFIEIDKSIDTDEYYLVIHSGSRHLGTLVAQYYQGLAIGRCISENRKDYTTNDLAYLEGIDYEAYLHDIDIVQEYARENHKTIIEEITDALGVKIKDSFTTMHNYIDTDFDIPIIRKGAVAADEYEKLIIPINMRDGSLICEGFGNPDWNYSAPHGAGRLMSRGQAKRELSLEDYKKTMKDIYSSSVEQSTLDEAPNAYKSIGEIKETIRGSVDIVKEIKPIYNYKAH